MPTLAQVAVLLLWSSSAAAQAPAIDRAKAFYDDLEFERAARTFDSALDDAASAAERAEIYAYIGLCRIQLGDEQGARRAFREALTEHSTAKLPLPSSPKIRGIWNDEAAALRRASAANKPAHPRRPAPMDSRALPGADIAADVRDDTSPTVQTRWPTYVAAGTAAVLGAAGAYFGMATNRSVVAARDAEFAYDADQHLRVAKQQATTANVLFGGAAGAALLGVAFYFVF